MNITIAKLAYSRSYNLGRYNPLVEELIPDRLYSVHINGAGINHPFKLEEILIAWGFAYTKADVSPLIETMLAACELIYTTLKETQDAN